MKLLLSQLGTHLKNNLSALYLISSDELLLVQETVDTIKNVAKKNNFQEHIHITADTGNDWATQLHAKAHSLSFFSNKQFIELNMHHAKFNATTTKAIQDYADHPPLDTLLIIRTNKIDNKTEKSAWFQKLEKKCVYIPIWPISASQLPGWLIERAKKMGLSLAKESAELIAEQSEGNLLAAEQELEKLFLLQIDCPLSKETLHHTLTDNAHYSIFDLVDTLLSGKAEKSLRILHSLKEEDTEPTLLLWALAREFRIMSHILQQQKQNVNIASLFAKYQIYEKRQSHVRQFLQRHTLTTCYHLLLACAKLDRVIKGGESGNIWEEFERLILFSLFPKRESSGALTF